MASRLALCHSYPLVDVLEVDSELYTHSLYRYVVPPGSQLAFLFT